VFAQERVIGRGPGFAKSILKQQAKQQNMRAKKQKAQQRSALKGGR
jgi:hypothetical protein